MLRCVRTIYPWMTAVSRALATKQVMGQDRWREKRGCRSVRRAPGCSWWVRAPVSPPADGGCGTGGHATSSATGFWENQCQFSISLVSPTALFLFLLLYLVSVWHSACQIPLASCIIFCYADTHNSSLFSTFLSPFLSFLPRIAFYVVILFISTLGFSFIY